MDSSEAGGKAKPTRSRKNADSSSRRSGTTRRAGSCRRGASKNRMVLTHAERARKQRLLAAWPPESRPANEEERRLIEEIVVATILIERLEALEDELSREYRAGMRRLFAEQFERTDRASLNLLEEEPYGAVRMMRTTPGGCRWVIHQLARLRSSLVGIKEINEIHIFLALVLTGFDPDDPLGHDFADKLLIPERREELEIDELIEHIEFEIEDRRRLLMEFIKADELLGDGGILSPEAEALHNRQTWRWMHARHKAMCALCDLREARGAHLEDGHDDARRNVDGASTQPTQDKEFTRRIRSLLAHGGTPEPYAWGAETRFRRAVPTPSQLLMLMDLEDDPRIDEAHVMLGKFEIEKFSRAWRAFEELYLTPQTEADEELDDDV